MNNYEFEFEEVYTKNSHLIYHIAYSYLKNSEDAKDIHQEVFFKYLSKKPKIKTLEEVKYWLIRVTINESINLLNHKKRFNLEINDELINNLLVKKEANEEKILYTLICDLEPIYKDIILLYYYDDMKTNEIAKLLKKKESTIRMRLHRARNILKERMEEYENGSK